MKAYKSVFCLILALVLVFAAGCGGNGGVSAPDESPAEASEAGSEAASEAESEASAAPAEKTDREILIDATLSGSCDRTLPSANLLAGMKYKLSADPSPDYPEKGNILTDGKSPIAFDADVWLGFYNVSGMLTVDFDLGEVKNGILDFSVDALSHIEYGIAICSAVKIYVAAEEGEFVEVGAVYPPNDLASHASSVMQLKLQGAVSARYIRFEFARGSAVWMFVGEVTCTAYGEEYKGAPKDGMADSESYYGLASVPEITTPEYWDSGESDYDTEKNLVKGVSPMVFFTDPLSAEIAVEWYNTKNTAILSNGVKAKNAVYSDGAWFHITHGGNRDIVFDLGRTSAVTGFSAEFLRDEQPNVNLPRNLKFMVSENGKDWQLLYSSVSVTTERSQDIVAVGAEFKDSYKARYARLTFTVNGHAYIDEIEVYGKKNASKAKDLVPDYLENGGSAVGEYITPAEFDGIRNIMLSYNCLRGSDGSHTESGFITSDEYLPYVAYIDGDGKIADTFFDGFLYLPYTAYNYSDYCRTADGWRFYVDDIYYGDRNMAALDECVGKVKASLGDGDYKVSVFTAVLYTFKTRSDGSANVFGDIDGDGKAEDFDKIADRKKAIKWIMDAEYDRFRAGNYGNLEFKGFYWFEEFINYNDKDEKELIRFASDYAHKLGAKLIWIPYFNATGYADWKELGFDLACKQPNYMFNSDATSEMLYINAEQTKELGMCVEMELTGPTNKANAARFEEYMIAGAVTGYMHAVKIYYQDGVPGALYTAYSSADPGVRRLYDDCYLYATERFEISDAAEINLPPEAEFSGKKGRTLTGKIDLGDLAGYAGSLAVALSPRYGALRLNGDGSFNYYAPRNFVGDDSFAVCIDLGYAAGTPMEITVHIG
ncbi:MAG: DUF4855 domain-containing protein [Clostridia bacterium]|nr:DUF4855 domain-containing protein [Clostridia bacterium]